MHVDFVQPCLARLRAEAGSEALPDEGAVANCLGKLTTGSMKLATVNLYEAVGTAIADNEILFRNLRAHLVAKYEKASFFSRVSLREMIAAGKTPARLILRWTPGPTRSPCRGSRRPREFEGVLRRVSRVFRQRGESRASDRTSRRVPGVLIEKNVVRPAPASSGRFSALVEASTMSSCGAAGRNSSPRRSRSASGAKGVSLILLTWARNQYFGTDPSQRCVPQPSSTRTSWVFRRPWLGFPWRGQADTTAFRSALRTPGEEREPR